MMVPVCPIVVFASLAASVQEPPEMTLEQAVQIARTDAFGVLSARAEAERSAGAISEVTASALPRLTFDASYTRFTNENKVTFGPMQPPTIFRPFDRASLQLRVVQGVDMWGVSRLVLSGARALGEVGEALIEAAMNDAELDATVAFFQAIRAEDLVAVAEESLANANLRLDIAEKRVAAEVAPKFEIIRAEAEVTAAEQELLRAQNAVGLATSTFNNVLARDAGTPVRLSRPSPTRGPPTDPAALGEKAKEHRPEVRMARMQLLFQKRFREGQQKGNLPSLNISAQIVRDPYASGFGAERDTVSGSAVLSFPIFEGGQTRARVKQARQEERKAQILLDQTLLGVELEVRQAFLNVQTAAKLIESARKNVEQAAEALRLAQVRYEAGVGTQIEISDANVQYVRARVALITAQYDYREAYARLQRAVGTKEL
ncbi:MAG: TolC family protein [Armatimonadetes bacterium]|nr:TolC family protein [Armatimonadota bacterium]